jgi:hypothetical protein
MSSLFYSYIRIWTYGNANIASCLYLRKQITGTHVFFRRRWKLPQYSFSSIYSHIHARQLRNSSTGQVIAVTSGETSLKYVEREQLWREALHLTYESAVEVAAQWHGAKVTVTKLHASRPLKDPPPLPSSATLSQQYSEASFAPLQVLSFLHSPGLQFPCCNVALYFLMILKHAIWWWLLDSAWQRPALKHAFL